MPACRDPLPDTPVGAVAPLAVAAVNLGLVPRGASPEIAFRRSLGFDGHARAALSHRITLHGGPPPERSRSLDSGGPRGYGVT